VGISRNFLLATRVPAGRLIGADSDNAAKVHRGERPDGERDNVSSRSIKVSIISRYLLSPLARYVASAYRGDADAEFSRSRGRELGKRDPDWILTACLRQPALRRDNDTRRLGI